MEAVLSVDNALALAALVHGRLNDPIQQKKALRFGILFAYLVRMAVVFGGVWLMSHEWVRWIAALYLIYLSNKELFFSKKEPDNENNSGGLKFKWLTPFVSTIIAVEVMDLMFSVDSIAVALTISSIPLVLIGGAVMGIFAMRFTAGIFIKLIQKFPILEKVAFVLVMFAGLKIGAELLGFHVPEITFTLLMFGTVAASMLFNKLQPNRVARWLD
jgi:YkoY family integral membrane protein